MTEITRRKLALLGTTALLVSTLPKAALATNAAQFLTDYLAMANQLAAVINQAKALRDRVAQDSTLFTQAIAAPNNRPDLTVTTLSDADAAIGQVIFAWDSGSPTQKSYVDKLL